MFNSYQPVPEIERFGYTQREALFLALVARLSGFFLARQYERFLKRKPGALTQQLLSKGQARGHIAALDYGQRRYVYHLKSRTLYRLVQDEDSPSRQIAGHDQIRAKLMMLDYALRYLRDPFLVSPQEKRQHFQQFCGISLARLPGGSSQCVDGNDESMASCFANRSPIYVPSNDSSMSPKLFFTYFDHGLGTIQPFVRYLESQRPLLEEVDEFKMVYVGVTDRNFQEAAHSFNRIIAKSEATSTLVPHGLDHLVQFLEAKRLWDQNDARLTGHHIAVLTQGENIYDQPEHEELARIWANRREKFRHELARLAGIKLTDGRVSFEILRENYPIFWPASLRRSRKLIVESQIGRISGSNSIIGETSTTKASS